MSFYDDDWMRLCSKYPLVAKKIEQLRCETVAYEQFEGELKKLRLDMRSLATAITGLLEVFVEELMKGSEIR